MSEIHSFTRERVIIIELYQTLGNICGVEIKSVKRGLFCSHHTHNVLRYPGYHCAGKRKGCPIPPPKTALPETQLYVLWVFWLKTRISEGYSAAHFHPIHLKFGIYTRLGVFNLSLKFQVSISSRTEVTEGSHLPKIQCNTYVGTRARVGETLFINHIHAKRKEIETSRFHSW